MISKQLKTLRKQQNLKQSDIAKHLGINQASYARWESGQTKPTSDKIQKLADFFDVTTDYLLGQNSNTANIAGDNNKIIQVDTNNDGINFYQKKPEDTKGEATHRVDVLELLTEMMETQKEILKELKKINKKGNLPNETH